MVSANFEQDYRSNARYVAVATEGDEDLGPLKLLPGTWSNTGDFAGRGWNMIALPFASGDGPLDYRLLMNQYNEELKFSLVDKGVPNRGVDRSGDPSVNTDQLVVTLDYEQMIKQTSADDFPVSGLAGDSNLAIHHEPGLFLNMTNLTTDNIDVARLATVPHGDAALALGRAEVIDGPPTIPQISGLPLNAPTDLTHPYLAPYKHFEDTPFKGTVPDPGFPGFSPANPNALLGFLPDNVTRTTVLHLDTTIAQGGIRNIPFIVKQANAAEMQSTFWIMERDNSTGGPALVVAYSQFILLDFFENPAGDIIRWPHVSINMMEKVAAPDAEKAQMPAM